MILKRVEMVVVGVDMEVEMVVEVKTATVKMMKVSEEVKPVVATATGKVMMVKVLAEVVMAKVKVTMAKVNEAMVMMVLEKMELMVRMKVEVTAGQAKFSPHLRRNANAVKMENEG